MVVIDLWQKEREIWIFNLIKLKYKIIFLIYSSDLGGCNIENSLFSSILLCHVDICRRTDEERNVDGGDSFLQTHALWAFRVARQWL